MIGAFLFGCFCMDQILYWEHRMSHSKCLHYLCKLHINRHHRTYPRDLSSTSVVDTTWIPSIYDINASILIPGVIIPLQIYSTFNTITWAIIHGAFQSMVLAFALHTFAHTYPNLCPSWYRNFHRGHHAIRTTNFGVLTPVPDIMFGTFSSG